jgi:hypothetical protein
MATDYARLSLNLSNFYDFTGKVVLYIGAGGRQLLAPTVRTRKSIAIDRDAEALQRLKREAAAQAMQDSLEVIAARFEDVTRVGDVVYFEFCLHEMEDPEAALNHARSLASDIVVYDHSVGSEWSFLCAEEEKVARSSAAMERFGIRRREKLFAEQRFGTFDELRGRVAPQGPVALERVQPFAGAADIVIPMAHELNLL